MSKKYYEALLHGTYMESEVSASRMFDLASEKEQNGLWATSMTLSDLVIFIFVTQGSCLTYFFILFFILVEKGSQLAAVPIITVIATSEISGPPHSRRSFLVHITVQ